MNVLVWFKRDLRATDHPALARAAQLGRVLPVHVVEPEFWAQPDASARQWAFTAECLTALREDLASLGAPLVVRAGDAVAVLERLVRSHGITHILSHADAGTPWSRARDRRVAAWARASGIRWEELPQNGLPDLVAEGADPAAIRDALVAQPLAEVPALTPVPGVEPGAIPSARALRLADDPCAHRQAGGRGQGLATLDSFLNIRGASCHRAMTTPATAERASSRLSPFLTAGALSLREVAQAAAARQAERPGGSWSGSLRGFQLRLATRGALVPLPETAAEAEGRARPGPPDPLHDSDAARLAAWAAGETGLPFVDASLRYLRATGWLPCRARALVMAVAAQHLGLDWHAAGLILARRFTDYDPGIHWLQVRQLAGLDGTRTPRIVNPVKQGLTHDPTGAFTRRWLPELAPVPDAFLHAPWRWHGAVGLLGRRYPEPVVDPAAARAPRDTLRRAPETPVARAPLVTRSRPQPAGQLSLDL